MNFDEEDILSLASERGSVTVYSVGKALGIGPSPATELLQRMQGDGLLAWNGKRRRHARIYLVTDKGRAAMLSTSSVVS